MDTATLVPVCVGACLCPGAPHADGDFVRVRPKPDLLAGVILSDLLAEWINAKREERPTQRLIRAQLTEQYVLLGVAEWDLLDEAGPIPVNEETIRTQLLSDFGRSRLVADQIDDLWAETLLLPLREQAQKFSQAMSSNGSTSATGNGSPKSRKRSKPSLTSTSQTAATEPISIAPSGDSSS